MTIDEAIEHAEEIACGNDQCAKDHAQLADWLRELRQVRIDIEVLKIFRDGFKEDAQKYKAENAKLRDELAKWERLADGIDLPEYPVTQFKPKDLERENSKLRELCEDMNKVAHTLCEAWEGSCSKEAEGMSLHAVCPIGDTSELCVFGKLHDRMREMGIGDSND